MIWMIYAPTKACKTSLGLTAPKPLVLLDTDLRSEGALPRFPNHIIVTDFKDPRFKPPYPEITVKRYPQMPNWGKAPKGQKALWTELTSDYQIVMENPDIRTIQLDTMTGAWKIDHEGYLEERQEVNPNKQKLIEIEYTEPNKRMRTLINAARAYNKNLIVIYHETDEYVKKEVVDKAGNVGIESVPTGKKVPDGFRRFEVAQISDVILYMTLVTVPDPKDKTRMITLPQARIECNGLCIAANGIEIIDPTWDKIMGVINGMRGI
jgi:hypothetical protein